MGMKHKVELRPFTVPSYVIQVVVPRLRQDGWREAPKFHLSEIDRDTLIDMCAEFQAAVLKKAEQPDLRLGE